MKVLTGGTGRVLAATSCLVGGRHPTARHICPTEASFTLRVSQFECIIQYTPKKKNTPFASQADKRGGRNPPIPSDLETPMITR